MSLPEILSADRTIRNITLNRLRFECEYYLLYGYRNPSRLLERSEQAHIDAMKALWESYPPDDKPEWLTMEQILSYEILSFRKISGRKKQDVET